MASGPVGVTSADIARIAGVRPAAVSNWRRRHNDFPRPVGGTDRSPRFDLAQVESWLHRQGRPKAVSAGERLWQAFDSARGVIAAEDALTAVGALLLHQADHPNAVMPTDPAALAAVLASAEHAWAPALVDAVESAGRPVPADVPELAALLRAAADAAQEARVDAENVRKALSTVFDVLCARYLDAAGRAGFTATPSPLADLMVRLSGVPAGRMLDLACGSGTILLAAADHGCHSLMGQELNPTLARITALRLSLRGIAVLQEIGAVLDIGSGPADARIQVGDSLRGPTFPPAQAAAVVCNPPFADRNWGYDDLANAATWEYGVPSRTESELAWIQQALALVAPGGTVVMLVPPGTAMRPSGRRVRRALLTRGALMAVVSLPAGLASHYSLALQIWILRRPDERTEPGHLLLVDTADAAGSGTRQASGSDAASVWGAVGELALECWEKFRADPAGFPGRPGAARAVPLADLLDEDIDLTPRRHLLAEPAPGITDGDIAATRDRFVEALSAIRDALPEATPLPDLDRETVRAVALGDLVKTGTLFIRRGPTTGVAAPGVDGRPASTVEGRILTGADIAAGVPPSGVGEVDGDDVRNPPIRSGDVLVPLVARRLRARVATPEDIGAYPAPTVYVVRADPAVLDPWFLAGYLSSGDGARQAERLGSSLGGDTRVDLRRVRIPLVPVERQRAYGQRFVQVAEFARSLRAAHDLGLDLARDYTDVIALSLTRAIEVGPSAP